MLLGHLKGTYSYGVFATNYTKFMLFDFDFKDDEANCKWYYRKVFSSLIELGIPEENLYTVFSGSKGVHLTVYFKEPVKVEDAKHLYTAALVNANCIEMMDKIEFRPTSNQGVKLPLGLHTVTRKRVCFIDSQNLKNQYSEDYIFSVKKLPAHTFLDVISRIKDSLELFPSPESPNSIEHISSPNNQFDISYIVDIWENGLKQTGTRHKMTFMLILYFKTYLEMDKDIATDEILSWLSKQDKSKYTTSWEDAIKDTSSIIDYIYNNNKTLACLNNEVTFTAEELYNILTSTKLNGKHFTFKQLNVLFAFHFQSKRFTDERKRTFYLTYNQIADTVGYKNTGSIRRLLEEFEQANLIKIHRRNSKQDGTYLKAVNLYEILPSNKKITIQSNVDSITLNSDLGELTLTEQTLKQLTQTFFDKKQFENALPRRLLHNLYT